VSVAGRGCLCLAVCCAVKSAQAAPGDRVVLPLGCSSGVRVALLYKQLAYMPHSLTGTSMLLCVSAICMLTSTCMCTARVICPFYSSRYLSNTKLPVCQCQAGCRCVLIWASVSKPWHNCPQTLCQACVCMAVQHTQHMATMQEEAHVDR
jgi:hypothetical protein